MRTTFGNVLPSLVFLPDAGAVRYITVATATEALGDKKGDEEEPGHAANRGKGQDPLEPGTAVSTLTPGGAGLCGGLSSSSREFFARHIASPSAGNFVGLSIY